MIIIVEITRLKVCTAMIFQVRKVCFLRQSFWPFFIHIEDRSRVSGSGPLPCVFSPLRPIRKSLPPVFWKSSVSGGVDAAGSV